MKKIAIGLIVTLALLGSVSKVHAVTYDDLLQTINELKAQVSSLQAQVAAVLLSRDTTSETKTSTTKTTETDPNIVIRIYIAPVKQGDTGKDVVELQNYLIDKGYLAPGSNVGIYGPKTAKAVKELQEANGIKSSDGKNVGPKTLAVINGETSTTTNTIILDMCPNLDGVQTTLTPQYQLDAGGNCICANGYIGLTSNNPSLSSSLVCVPKTNLHSAPVIVDVCPNIAGVQATIPAGYINIPNLGCVPAVITTTPGPTKGTSSTVPPGFYLMAGHDNTQTFHDLWKMNTTTNVWTEIDNIPSTLALDKAPWSAREYPESVYFNGKIYLMGGIDASGYLNDVWSYDGSVWTQVTQHAPWPARARFASVVWNNQIWVVGGRTTLGNGLNDIWKSSDGVNWISVGIAPWNIREGFKALVSNNNLWVMGGTDINNNHPLNDVWSFDGTNWTYVAPNSTFTSSTGFPYIGQTVSGRWLPRTLLATASYNNKMWVMGGFEKKDLNNGGNWTIELGNDLWSSLDGSTWTNNTQNIWPASNTSCAGQVCSVLGRRELTTAVFNNKIWAMAGSYINAVDGESNEYFYNDVWNFDGAIWTEIAHNTPWAARDGLTSVLVQ